MNITVTAKTLERDVQLLDKANQKVKATLWATVRRVALATMRRVKIAMPVDTGRARASWGVWGEGGNIREVFQRTLRRASKGALSRGQAANYAAASPQDSIWKLEESALRVTQGSNLPYIERLNTGHSEQAPRGFLDTAAAAADASLQTEVAKAIDAMWLTSMPSSNVPGGKP